MLVLTRADGGTAVSVVGRGIRRRRIDLQHLALHRDLDLLVVEADHDPAQEYLLPRGPLREPLEAAALGVELAEPPWLRVLVEGAPGPGVAAAFDAHLDGPAIGAAPVRGGVSRINPAGFTKVSSLGVDQQRVPVIITFEPDALEKLKPGQGFELIPPHQGLKCDLGFGRRNMVAQTRL